MADQSISQLGVASTPLTGNEVTVVVQNGVTKQTSLQNIANLGGPTGPQGPVGPQGPTGPAATVQVQSTTTTAPGTDANVINIGSPNNAFLEFFIPRGDTGATGATGPTGPVGPGVAAGGTAGQYLRKVDSTNYNTSWADLPTYVSTVSGTTNQINVANGSTNAVISLANNPVLPGTAATLVPVGTTAQRAGVTATNGLIRYNTDTALFEGYVNGSWSSFASGSGVTSIATGTGLTGGPITSTGTISIANTGVTAASYGSASKTLTATVNAQGQLTALADTNIAISNTQVSGLGTAATLNAGVANGVATLDSGGTIPLSQIPASLIGALSYQGTWDASTNTPTLTSSVGTKGFYYVVNVAGSTNLNGITDWLVGDWAVFNGSVWQKIDNTDSVTSVNGQTGTVVLTTSNIAEGSNLYYTDARARAALSAGTGISYNSTTGVITNSAPSLGGDVVGPASATDNAVTRFDTTTGKLIQNSLVTISDAGQLALPAASSSSAPLYMPYGTEPTSPVAGNIWTAYTGLYFKNADNNIEQLDVGANTPGVLTAPTITVAGSGATFDATSVEAVLFSLPNWAGDYRKYVVPAATGLALTDQSANYLVVKYNGGSPVYDVTTNVGLIDNSSIVGAALLWRNGTQVHFQPIDWGRSTASRINRRLVQTNRYQWASGLALGESTGRVITLTSGVVWYGVDQYNETSQTSASSNAEFWYHVGGVWTSSTVSTYNNTQYDNGTNLVATGGANYTVNWVYRYIDGSGLPKLAYILGTANYNLAQAQASTVPTPPPILSTMAILVGRIIVVHNGTTATQIDSAFTQVFQGSTVTNHNDLNGLQGGAADEYYHLSAAQHTIATQAASATQNGYLTSTDGSTFNSKGSGSVTSVSGTGTVNGLTLTGTVTTSGSLTLGGTLDLSSPPAIGGTTPAAITGTTITATKYVGISGGTF